MAQPNGPARPRESTRASAAFGVAVLRGFGQVDLQPSLLTGGLILVSLWVAGWKVGLFASLGTVVSTLTALALRVDRDSIRLGLQGYCGCLTAIALVTYLGHHVATYVLAITGAMLCTLLTSTLTTLLTPYRLTALTAPFCLVSGAMVLGAPSFRRVWHGGEPVPSPTTGASSLSFSDLWHGFFSNIAQVFLVPHWYVGLIMLVALLAAGWAVGAYAAAGSGVGLLVAWALGAPRSLIAQGIYGYNAVLVAIAVGAVFLHRDAWSTGYALFGAAASTGLTGSLTSFFSSFDGHTFTWPFILTTWMLMAAAPRLAVLRPAGQPATP